MDELMSVRCLATLPVVTLGGDAVAHVKDAVFDPAAERIAGFTLTGRALWSGQLPQDLPWPAVYCLGRDAVMVRDRDALIRRALRGETVTPWRDVIAVTEDRVVVRTDTGEEAGTGETERGTRQRDLLGCRVLTETGEERGTVLDAALDPVTGRIETIRTSLAELRADRMLGLGEYALVVRAARADRI
ncbi:hypothetical protein GCM10009535_24590 [Streptomyces thermocarboxydovorans]|uniref:PRC-barrel domain-containing protein n=1 Tax=Streptomyces thermocarboxydovorans TaxID=59298 RepID=A0ABP3SRH5_9ACTN